MLVNTNKGDGYPAFVSVSQVIEKQINTNRIISA